MRIDIICGIAIFAVIAFMVYMTISIYWPYAVIFVLGLVGTGVVIYVQKKNEFKNKRKH